MTRPPQIPHRLRLLPWCVAMRPNIRPELMWRIAGRNLSSADIESAMNAVQSKNSNFFVGVWCTRIVFGAADVPAFHQSGFRTLSRRRCASRQLQTLRSLAPSSATRRLFRSSSVALTLSSPRWVYSSATCSSKTDSDSALFSTTRLVHFTDVEEESIPSRLHGPRNGSDGVH